MFDDVNNQKRSIEDIFAETEAKSFNAPAPSQPSMQPPPPPVYAPVPSAMSAGAPESLMSEPKSSGGMMKWLIIGGLVLVVGGGAWAAYQYWYLPSIAEVPAPVNTEDTTNTELQNTNVVPENNTPTEQQPAATTDTDGDQLNDSQEFTLGTDQNNSDSDYDGLFDGEEVNIYHTNPLSPDSDGDGFFDGTEVDNGYNPAGDGRLLELPNGELNLQEINNIISDIDKQPS